MEACEMSDGLDAISAHWAKFERVSKDEFSAWLKAYPRKLDFNGDMLGEKLEWFDTALPSRPVGTWEHLMDTRVAYHNVYADRHDDGQIHYMIWRGAMEASK